METSSQITITGRASDGQITPAPKRERARPAPQPPLPSRKELDLRVAANKHFHQLVTGVIEDLGGHLSTVQEGLVEAWAGCRVNLDDLNTRLLRGEPIDQEQFNISISNMIALSESLGLKRSHSSANGGGP